MELEHLTGDAGNTHWNLSGDEICNDRSSTPIWHRHDLAGSCQRFEELAGQMLDRTDTGVPVRDLAGIGVRICDELPEAEGRHRRMHGDTKNVGGHCRDRIEVFDRV